LALDTTTPDSPGWWLNKLAKKLQGRLPRLQKLAAYHDGNPPLPEGNANVRSAFEALRKKARTNFAELIVGSVRERCSVRTIRTALGITQQGDSQAWDLWRENNLDIEFADVLENMLALGDGYMIVGLDPDDPESVVITGEDPRQVVTIHDPARQSVVRAAAKFYHDPDEAKDYAYLYLAGYTETTDDGATVEHNARRFVATRDRKVAARAWSFSPGSYNWDDERGGIDGEELNHKYVPVVRFRNRRGIGEFEPHTDILDRINHTLLMRMVIAQYQAFKQRALHVDEDDMPDEDENGREINYDDVFTSDPGAWLKIPFNAKVWESTQADLTGILSAIKDDVQHLAAVTRTPLSVVSPDAVNQSAEGSALIKEGQIFKTEDKQKRAAASLVLVFMIAFLALGDKARADKKKLIVDWAPAERYSLQQKYDAASKAPTAGVPTETIFSEILQFSPELIEIAKGQQLDDAFRQGLSTSGPAPTAPAPANAA
jgi:hypothetical protein